jgi:hypothetical protein
VKNVPPSVPQKFKLFKLFKFFEPFKSLDLLAASIGARAEASQVFPPAALTVDSTADIVHHYELFGNRNIKQPNR